MTTRGPAPPWVITASCRSSSTVSLSAHARSSFPTRMTPTKTEACTTVTRSVGRHLGFLGAVPAVARQERSRPTPCPASTLTRKLLALSLAGRVQLDDSRASAAVALQTLASRVHLESHRFPGATACTNCLFGMFKSYEMLECASCQPGFFVLVLG